MYMRLYKQLHKQVYKHLYKQLYMQLYKQLYKLLLMQGVWCITVPHGNSCNDAHVLPFRLLQFCDEGLQAGHLAVRLLLGLSG